MALGTAKAEAIALAALLSALASPNRLLLLRALRSPLAVTEIRLGPEPSREGDAERPIARQSVSKHLAKLVEAGVVVPRAGERDFGPTTEYVVNHARLFALAEEFRELAKLRPHAPGLDEPTIDSAKWTIAAPVFPRLLVVKGLAEGATFPLVADGRRGGEWTIGRRQGADVCLDYDPFVSLDNTRVLARDAGFAVQDLPASRNGASLNFAPLPRGSIQPFAHGDVLGVGRTLFVLQTRGPSPAARE